MVFLALAIIGGSALSIVMRLSEGRVQSKISMLAVNYAVCMLLCGPYMGFDLSLGTEGSSLTFALGLITGIFYVASLLLMQLNIRKNGVILPSVFSRLGGLLVPLAAAICFFGEAPTWLQVLGSGIAALSIVTINTKSKNTSATSVAALLSLLLTDGCAAAMSTVYEKLGNSQLGTQFLFYTFSTALLICLILIFKRKEGFGKKEVLYGIGIGVPNFFASRCLLLALETVPAVIAYPTRGVASIVIVTLAGILMFGERLQKLQWAALGAILVAVVLLNV